MSEMPRLHKIRSTSPVQLYGWDSPTKTWHGPDEMSSLTAPNKQMLQALRSAAGKSWYGPVRCCSSRFFALAHDLSDCAAALIYCDESKAGPAEIVAVIPAVRRAHLRDDFAFEFLAFARFFGALDAGDELQVHDAIASAIADKTASATLVFSISSGLWPADLADVLSHCIEQVALTLTQWLEESPVSPARPSRGSIFAA